MKKQREFLLISTICGSTHISQDTWLIDNGASRHMTSNQEVLSNLSNEDMIAQIVLGNDIKFTAKGTGSASFILDTGDIVYVENILYVPGLKKNLISVSALEDKGYTVGFSKG